MGRTYTIKLKYKWFDWYLTQTWKEADLILTDVLDTELLDKIAIHKYRCGGNDFYMEVTANETLHQEEQKEI